MLMKCRKDIPGLVEDFVGVCQYWDCGHAAVCPLHPLLPSLRQDILLIGE
jgi:hypothetical protein